MSALYIFRNLNDILLHIYHILYILHVIYEIEYCTRERSENGTRLGHEKCPQDTERRYDVALTS